jgi:hypothetical protein
VDRTELQTIQRPLKERYRSEPTSALVTLTATRELDEQAIACSVATDRALVEAGLHPATGGSGGLACSGDMLLQALVACAGATLRSVATSMEIPVSGTVMADGDLDFRGTLGVDKTRAGTVVAAARFPGHFSERGLATRRLTWAVLALVAFVLCLASAIWIRLPHKMVFAFRVRRCSPRATSSG